MSPRPPAARIGWLTAYAAAMGVLEAAVVVYLRELYYPGGFRFPVATMAPRLAAIEAVRELMTLVMLLAVAMLRGGDRHDRFYAFAYLFGVWDLVYYAGLKGMLGWPPSLGTWDILFLLPVPWLSPVVYPIVVSAFLIAGFLVHERLRASGGGLRLRAAAWCVAAAGCALIVVAFCWRFRDVARAVVPDRFPWPLFAVGLLVAVAPFAAITARSLRS